MIVDFFLGLLFGILNAVFALIPTFDFGTDAWLRGVDGSLDTGNAVYMLIASWYTVDLFYPITMTLMCIGSVLGTKTFVAFTQFLKWVWSVIPAKGT